MGKQIVEDDLGAPLTSVFKSFETTPLASASVAQVHGARLLDGSAGVVKVQKPEVSEELKADLGFLTLLAQSIQLLLPNLERVSLAGIVEDLRESMLGELDFRKELE